MRQESMSFEVHPGKDPPVPSAVGYYAKLPAKLIARPSP